jgi:hypothetical protein
VAKAEGLVYALDSLVWCDFYGDELVSVFRARDNRRRPPRDRLLLNNDLVMAV